MDPARWQRIESVFQDALERTGPERGAFLREACGADTALQEDVERLLAQHDGRSILDAPLLAPPQAGGDTVPDLGPERLGPYRLVRVLGEGGMGTVYLAVQEGPGFERPVALKVMRRGLDTDDLLRRFQLERRILAALRHPNIAHLLDAQATPDGRPFFAMEFIEGEPIDRYCERRSLTVPQRLRLFQQVCGAVQHAHSNLIVHRDIKPGNILVRPDGSPVLLDFGIGKLLDVESGDQTATRTTTVRAFTPEYAAPEQVRGDPVSTATDVYGLGGLLYRLLGRRHPFGEVASPAELERAVLETDPAPLGLGDLDNIVLRALRKEPGRRYASVAAFSDDVERYLDGRPVLARPDTFGYRAGKFIRRNRLPLGAATVAFLALAVATLYSMAQARAVARERDKALEVQGFLIEMFGAGGQGRADSVSIRQLLDRQAASIATAYADRPELRGQMLAVVGEGYFRLGLLTDAERVVREALAVRQAALPAQHADIAQSLSALGNVFREQGRDSLALPLLRQAAALWPRARPANPLGYSRTLNDLGVILLQRGLYGEADTAFGRALDIRRRLLGDGHRSVAVTASNLSLVLYRKGDYRRALEVGDEGLAVMRRAVGPDHQRSSIVQNQLVIMRAALGDVQGAEAEYRELVERQTRVSGRRDSWTAWSLAHLGVLLLHQGRAAEAEPLLVEALGILREVHGTEHQRVAFAMGYLGAARSALGRFAEAGPLLDSGLGIRRRLLGEVHRDVGEAWSLLGLHHANLGRLDDAVGTHRQAVETWARALGETHIEVAVARTRLAHALLRRGDAVEALDQYRAAYAAFAAASGMRPAGIHAARLRVAQALIALGRYPEADSLLAFTSGRVEAGEGSPSTLALLDSARAARNAAAP